MDKCNAGELLKANKLKRTNQRLLVLEEIMNLESNFSVNTLADRLTNRMDLVTIYRILDAFVEKSIIRETVTVNNMKFYEMSCVHNPVHAHFICTKCHKIVCIKKVEEDEIKRLEKYASEYTVENVCLTFTGLCKNC